MTEARFTQEQRNALILLLTKAKAIMKVREENPGLEPETDEFGQKFEQALAEGPPAELDEETANSWIQRFRTVAQESGWQQPSPELDDAAKNALVQDFLLWVLGSNWKPNFMILLKWMQTPLVQKSNENPE